MPRRTIEKSNDKSAYQFQAKTFRDKRKIDMPFMFVRAFAGFSNTESFVEIRILNYLILLVINSIFNYRQMRS